MKIVLVGILSALSLTVIPSIQIKSIEIPPQAHAEALVTTETIETPQENETPREQAENSSDEKTKTEPKKLDPVKDNPNKCNLDTQYVWEDFSCHDKPVTTTKQSTGASSTSVSSDKNARVPVGVHDIGGYGDCVAEIAKYDWGQSTALAVARAESGLRPGVINNNPGTRDYSIGCFQVNIYGANARNRPSQAELINAATNVRWAYNNYVGNGHSFIGQWGVCRKISCY